MLTRLLNLKNQYKQHINQEDLYHMFQPIYGISNFSFYGYEALLRSPAYTPETLFNLANQQDQLYGLDILSMENSIQTYSNSFNYEKGFLFINIFPSTLVKSFLYSSLSPFIDQSIPHERIVLEINESEGINNLNLFKEIINFLRDLNYRIAIDDMGKGNTSLSVITIIEPDIIKLDKWFSQNLHRSKDKQIALERMARFCGNDVELILEGIETANDLEIAQSLGIDFGQGYFLGKPTTISS